MKWRLAADTGGTFTDCSAVDPAGVRTRCKVLSSGCLRARVESWDADLRRLSLAGPMIARPEALVGWRVRASGGAGEEGRVLRAFGEGGLQVELEPSAERGDEAWPEGSLVELLTGEEAPVLGARLLTGTAPGRAFPDLEMRLATTRATNALLEGKGAPTVVWLNEGLEELLLLGDQRRPDLFALNPPSRPVFANWLAGVSGRLSAQGKEVVALDEERVREDARELRARGVTHAAVALLHSVTQPEHERRVGAWLKEEGFEHVTLSHQVAPFPKLLARAQSAVANATLTGPVQAFIDGVVGPLGGQTGRETQMMTSAGVLEPAGTTRPKDLLLSGPAGGAIGAAAAARKAGLDRVLTLDMGGTSTDVARVAGRPGYRFLQRVGQMELMAPSVAIETVAAGGGSICAWTRQGLRVGPESAGAEPGPACYGKGGPLTITDVNLLLGRFDPERAPIPLDPDAARLRLQELKQAIAADGTDVPDDDALLHGLLDLAVEHMAEAMRRISVAEGFDPADHALLAFGGAGPQHACAVAERLGICTVLVPVEAGTLSAAGLHAARSGRFAERTVGLPLEEANVSNWVAELRAEACAALRSDLGAEAALSQPLVLAELRLRGQETPLQVEVPEAVENLAEVYGEAYQRLFGYPPPEGRVVELVSLRVSVEASEVEEKMPQEGAVSRPVAGEVSSLRLIQDAFSTLVIAPGWRAEFWPGVGHLLKHELETQTGTEERGDLNATPRVLRRELLRHRLHAVVEEMGALLCRTALSTNIRERLDFSCALLDADGQLISSAPHIPVHLGALGECVRSVMARLPMEVGDTVVTNHPAYGGSHLPDITLITPVHDAAGQRIGFVANRAHHAEIGGMAPGSMPTAARCLEEEGVVIEPMKLIAAGESCFAAMEAHFRGATHPSRQVADNLADLHAQLAANQLGLRRLQELAAADAADLVAGMREILDHSAAVMRREWARLPKVVEAEEVMDDGAVIRVRGVKRKRGWKLDFTGTSAPSSGNLNATPAIVRSTVLYVLRLWVAEDLPLNEGLLKDVKICLPESFLNPTFTGDAARDPAVVGGNVEVSQRLADTLIKALNLQACSQGTMNNLLFGNASFGYYETVAGGGGGGPAAPGASCVHTHMTNTAITDPEVLEQRYPVRLWRFAPRHGSGGAGRFRGGDGVVRELEFLAPLSVSLLTQHRHVEPFGMEGGSPGKRGRQTWVKPGHITRRVLEPSCTIEVERGDRLILETPGGGGWGAPE